MLIEIDRNNSCCIELHPWDEWTLGYKVSELINLKCNSDSIFKLIDNKNQDMNITLCCSRQDSNNILMKKYFLENGFYIAENSLVLCADLSKIKAKKYIELRQAKQDDVLQLITIVREQFKHGRFHEDPFVNREKAHYRYERWLRQLIDENKCLVAENEKENIIGFTAYKVVEGSCDWLLTGLNSSHIGYGGFLFSSILHHLKSEASFIKTTISAANVDVLNLYSFFNFKVKYSLFGYHKWYKDNLIM